MSVDTGTDVGADPLRSFVGVVADGQTYKNLLYLALAFPLGLGYFIFLVTGYSTSLGLSVVLVGIPMLLGMIGATYLLFAFEQALTAILLPGEIPRPSFDDLALSVEGFTSEVVPASLVGLVYLLGKFAFGIVSFVLVVTLSSISFVLAAAPVMYDGSATVALSGGWIELRETTYMVGPWVIDTLPEAAVVSAAGIVFGLVSLHVFNLVARGYALYTAAIVSELPGE